MNRNDARVFSTLFAISIGTLTACDKKSGDAGAAQSTAAAAAAQGAPAASVDPPSGPCPDGSWVIASPKDQMQALFARTGARDMKVVETSGTTEYTFSPPGPDTGKYRMDASGGKALTLTVDAPVGNQTQRTRAEVTGIVEGVYKKLPTGELDLSNPSTMQVAAKATVSFEGKNIDLPAFNVPANAYHGTVRATCSGNAMVIVSSSGATFYNGLKLVRR